MTVETLAIVDTIIGGVNLILLVSIAFSGGRWMGRVETRIEVLERHMSSKPHL